MAFSINLAQHNSGQSRTQDRARTQKNVITEVVCGILGDEEFIKCTVVRQNKLTGPRRALLSGGLPPYFLIAV